MKGHKAHHHAHHARKHGGKAEHHGEGLAGVAEYKQDERTHPMSYTAHDNVAKEAEAKKRGGRTKRKHGGHVMHHHSGHVKHVGAVHGHAAKHHAGRKPRKSGGRASAESNPFSAARHGTAPKGRKLEMEME